MDRLTFDGNFCDIAQCLEHPCPYNSSCSQREVWERLKYYEDLNEREKNEPLTLDELKKLNEEPIWVHDFEIPKRSAWWLCYWDKGKYFSLMGRSIFGYLIQDYGETWVAYRNKPAETTIS